MDSSLGIKIKELRLKNNLTQKNFCGDFMDRTLLSKIENNSFEPSLSQLEYIANKLSVPISYFFNDIDYSNYINSSNSYNYSSFAKMYEYEKYINIIKQYENSNNTLNNSEDIDNFFYVGMSYFNISDDSNSIYLLRKFVNRYEKSNSVIQEQKVINFSIALNTLSKIMIKNSNYIKAEHYLHIARKYLLLHNRCDSFINFVVYNNLGHVYNNLNCYTKTISILEEFINTSNIVCYNRIMPNIHWSLNIAYYNIGDYENSVKHIKKAIYLFKYNENELQLGKCYINYINTLRYWNKLDEALTLIQAYKDKYLGNEMLFLKFMVQEMVVNFNMYNYDFILTIRSNISYNKLDRTNKIDYYFVLGHIYFLKDDYAKSKNYLKKCEKFLAHHNYTYDLTLLYQDLFIITQDKKYHDKFNYYKDKHGRKNILV